MTDEQWYTNRDLFEMVQGLKHDIAGVSTELAATREAIRRYNGLREELSQVGQRIAAIEQQAAGRSSVGKAIREWGGWLVGVAGLVIALAAKFGG